MMRTTNYRLAVLAIALIICIVGCAKDQEWTGLDMPLDKFIHDFNLLAKTSHDDTVQLKNVAFNGTIYKGDITNNDLKEGDVYIEANKNKIKRVTLTVDVNDSTTFGVAAETLMAIVAGDNADRITDAIMASEPDVGDYTAYYEYTEGGIQYSIAGMGNTMAIEALRSTDK